MRYKTYCFGDLVEKWIDNRGKTPPLSENGIPLLEVKHLPESNLYPKIVGTKFVDKETYDSWFRAYLEPNDILFSTVGTTARVVMTPPTETVAIAQNILGIRFKKDLVDPWFMFYYMRGKQFQHDIEARLVTTVQASIKRADMVGIPIAVPQLDAQKELVHRVISLDHKIQLNQDINQTLEQMAQALFKSWFVDFEPVKAKMAVLESGGSQADAMLAAMTAISGKDADALVVFEREQPEQYAELKATAELFPSAMQESELGEIPEGWELSSLSEKIKLIGGGTPKRSEPEFWNGDICWYSVKDAPADSDVFVIDTTEKITKKGLDKSSAKLLPIGTTIISARGTVGKLALTATEMAMNQSCYGISGGEFSGPLLTYLKVKQCVDVLKRNTHGAVFDTITTSTFDTVVTLTASKIVNHRFEKIVTPLFNDIENNLRTNASLTQLRDTLLPKLLSGEITLPEAEQAVSEVENV
ncbi:TPA: restriction endonuclease subunit S [Escherichia coli]|nr:restriction endonuclease subunit S [Escherichia coli]